MDLYIRLRPLQAGYRVATFDGGGVLGIVSLIALRRIVQDLPTALSVHHYFDLVIGTSTGELSRYIPGGIVR
jgi:patatin-like phospholipase/acyl hydrolase